MTEFVARGKTGMITVVNCVVERRKSQPYKSIIEGVDENAFVTVDQVSTLQHGYFRH